MKKVKSKFFNRTISVIYLLLFVVGIAVVGFSTYVVVSLYHENLRLQEVKDDLINNSHNNSEFEELHFDDYYSVYVENGYAIYDKDGTLIFFADKLTPEK